MKIPLNVKNMANILMPYNELASNFKKLLFSIIFVKIIMYSTYNIGFGVKYLLMAVVGYFTAKEVEILFFSHFKQVDRKEGREAIKETYPEITGLLIVIGVNFGVSITAVIVSVVFSIFIVKLAFGGFSFNIFNPAAAGIVFLRAGWKSQLEAPQLGNFTDKIITSVFGTNNLDIITKPIPIKNDFNFEYYSLLSLLDIGIIIFILFIIFFCVSKKIFNKYMSISILLFLFILTIILFVFVKDISIISTIKDYVYILSLSVLGICFYANDPITMANNKIGIIISGFIIAIITFYTVVFTENMYGVFYGILFANMMTPLFNKKFENK